MRSIRCIRKTSKNECARAIYTLPERLVAVDETAASFLGPCPALANAETPADRDVADVEPRLAAGSGPLAASDVPGSSALAMPDAASPAKTKRIGLYCFRLRSGRRL
jgi:hypothetical protein